MEERRSGVRVAVIRAIVKPPDPVIRIIELNELYRNEHVLHTTTSPDEAAEVVRAWLVDVIGHRAPRDHGGGHGDA